ncbi:hypothetical protein F5887DRAFT_919521 [Amanita rubescens]|nr:hypothetical protein F5887DRAFT_919521 [Amanita rubescens]
MRTPSSWFFEKVPEERRIVGNGTTRTRTDSLKILREMLNNAPNVMSRARCVSYYFLAHHLLVVKGVYKSKVPSVSTLGETGTSMTVMEEERESHFLQLLKERQANKCAVIEPAPGSKISTIGAQIIRRSIAKANKSNPGLRFEATNEPDVYNVKWLSEFPETIWALCGSRQVTFTDHSEAIPLPNARFLAIHAPLAKDPSFEWCGGTFGSCYGQNDQTR